MSGTNNKVGFVSLGCPVGSGVQSPPPEYPGAIQLSCRYHLASFFDMMRISFFAEHLDIRDQDRERSGPGELLMYITKDSVS
jgi:hypothetical protein